MRLRRPIKDRLYIILFQRSSGPRMPGKEDLYHWAFLVAPKLETKLSHGTKHHAISSYVRTGDEPPAPVWTYKKEVFKLTPERTALVRILIGKVRDKRLVDSVLGRVPLRADTIPEWNCIAWIKEDLEDLERNGKALGTSETSWQSVRDAAMWYCKEKTDEGRFTIQGDKPNQYPTWDILQGKETVD